MKPEDLIKELNENGKGHKDFSQCPSCKMGIYKDGGCNHMTCKNNQCRYEWCWLCDQKYDQNHFSRLNPLGCRQFDNDPQYNPREEWVPPPQVSFCRKTWWIIKSFIYQLLYSLLIYPAPLMYLFTLLVVSTYLFILNTDDNERIDRALKISMLFAFALFFYIFPWYYDYIICYVFPWLNIAIAIYLTYKEWKMR